MIDKSEISKTFRELQENICSEIENTDKEGKFKEDLWERPEGGGGRTRIIENGNIIEKGGVNYSEVYGEAPEKLFIDSGRNVSQFYATGVSIVLHPKNPYVPIIHMNVRYFEADDDIWWFGGGIDLTPHYVNKDDAFFFHKNIKKVCDRHDPKYYDDFKKQADEYFYIRHRKETRGVGGIFFDHLNEKSAQKNKDQLFSFVTEVGRSFSPVYTHFMKKNHNATFGEREKDWQMLRRGRYVEFNLVLDRGTKFGLETNGRIESILMSLPSQASWKYNYIPEQGSEEAKTLELLKKDINWINILNT